MRVAAICVLATACTTYQPGAIQPGPGGAIAAVDCLDVSITPRPELSAVGTVVEVAVGNRCDRAVRVDFTRLRAAGYAAFDPRDEIRPALLEARSVAVEVLEFRPASHISQPPCFDLSGMTPSPGTSPPICLDQSVAEVSL